MTPMIQAILACKKEKCRPEVALATVASIMCGVDLATDEELIKYCENWIKQNGKATYGKLMKFVENLGYAREISEISLNFDWTDSNI